MNEMDLLTRFRAEVPLRISPHAKEPSDAGIPDHSAERSVARPSRTLFARVPMRVPCAQTLLAPAANAPGPAGELTGGPAARAARAAISLAPSAPQVPFAWMIRLPWNIRATPVAQIDHVSQIFHGNFRMVELWARMGACGVNGTGEDLRAAPGPATMRWSPAQPGVLVAGDLTTVDVQDLAGDVGRGLQE